MNGRRTLIATAVLAAMLVASPAAQAAPITLIASGPPEYTNDTTPTFTFASDQADATFECRVYSTTIPTGTYTTCPATFTTQALTDGRHTLEVRARDTGGAVDTSPVRRSFNVDTVPPNTTVEGPFRTRDTTPTFHITASELRPTMLCRVNSRASLPCSSNPTASNVQFTIPGLKPRRRKHVLTVTATDRAGNADPTPAVFSFRILPRKRR